MATWELLQHKTNKYLSDSKFGGRLGADADQGVAVQAVIHIDAVAVEMEVMGSGQVNFQLFVQT